MVSLRDKFKKHPPSHDMDMTVDEKRAEMKRAVRYRSGPGMMNEVYLGSLAISNLFTYLGLANKYGEVSWTLQDAIDKADDEHIMWAWEYEGFQWILNHYRDHGSKLFKYEIVATEID